MTNKTPKINKKKSHKGSTRTKLPLFYKILLSLSIFFLLILFYFVVLVSSSPRSINFVTQKIQENLDKNFENRAKIGKSYVKFTSYGSFRIAINNIKISYKESQINKESNLEISSNKYFNIPKIEAEFPIFELIKFNFNPNKIKIFSPEIIVENPYAINDSSQSQLATTSNNNDQILLLIELLSSLRKNKSPIENFEIEDAKINFKNQKSTSIVIIKNAKISTKINKNTLDIFLKVRFILQTINPNQKLKQTASFQGLMA